LDNVKSAVQFRLVGLILAMTVFLPIWHSHCSRAMFTDFGNKQLWACRSLNWLLCLQRPIAKLASESFYYWRLLRITTTWQQIFEDALQVTIVRVLPYELLNADILVGNVMRQWLLIAISHVGLYQRFPNLG